MEKGVTNSLADNVRALMKDRNWTIVELAKRAGVSKSSVGYLVTYKDINDRHPTSQTIEAIAKAFDLAAWQLLYPGLMPDQPPTIPAQGDTKPQRASEQLDGKIYETALVMAVDSFAAARTIPSGKQVVGAARFIYDAIQRGQSKKAAAAEMRKLLEASSAKSKAFT